MTDYSKRISLLQKSLAKNNLDAILVSQPENRRYISGFTGSAGLCLVSNEDVILATDSRYSEQAKLQSPDYSILETLTSFNSWLPELLSGLSAGTKLGLETEHLTFATYTSIKKVTDDLNISLVSTSSMIENQRIIKDKDERDWLKKAIEITDKSLESAYSFLRPGTTEKELAWHIEQVMRNSGAEGIAFDLIVASGPNGAMAHHSPGNEEIVRGVPIVIDIGAKFNGYHADLTRTITLGKPDKQFNDIFDIVLAAQETAIATIKPGVTGNQADLLARQIIDESGHKDHFGHSLGHGVGLAVHEYPRLARSAPETLEEGMIFTVEPGIYIPGWGGIRIEDIVEFRDGQCWPISQAPKHRNI
jgi:Xaa-Pro aminopeptidase